MAVLLLKVWETGGNRERFSASPQKTAKNAVPSCRSHPKPFLPLGRIWPHDGPFRQSPRPKAHPLGRLWQRHVPLRPGGGRSRRHHARQVQGRGIPPHPRPQHPRLAGTQWEAQLNLNRPCSECGSTWLPLGKPLCASCSDRAPDLAPRKVGTAVDWALPLVAVPEQGGRETPVQIDRSFARVSEGQFVRFPMSVWTRRGPGGTWLVTADGLIASGLSPDGYNALFTVSNRDPKQAGGAVE